MPGTGGWTAQVYNLHCRIGDIGYWTGIDGVGAGVWIDLPDKQGLLYLTQHRPMDAQWYNNGVEDSDRSEALVAGL